MGPRFRARGIWPFGLLGMLLLVAGIEAKVGRHWLELGERRALAWRFSGVAAEAEAKQATLLCLGDSLVKLGLLPRLIEERAGLRTYNLAIPGGQAPGTTVLLDRALEAGVRPEALIVDFHPNLLASAPRFNTLLWSEILTVSESIELGLQARDSDLLTAILLSRLFPSYKDREGLRGWIETGLTGTVDPLRAEHPGMLRNWRVNAGAHVAPAVKVPDDENGSQGIGPEAGRWAPHRANLAYLRRFLERCESERIRVFWLLPPATAAWVDRRAKLGINADYERFVRSLMAEYTCLSVIDGQSAGYPDEVFRDSTHLHRRGAAILSRDLGAVVKRALDRPTHSDRWLALPSFQMRSDDLALEDVEQSRRILEESDSRRR